MGRDSALDPRPPAVPSGDDAVCLAFCRGVSVASIAGMTQQSVADVEACIRQRLQSLVDYRSRHKRLGRPTKRSTLGVPTP